MTSSPSTKPEELLTDYVIGHKHGLDIAELNDCLQRLSSEEIRKVVSETKNSRGRTAIHVAACRDHLEVIHSILNSVTEEARYELMRIQSKKGFTALHAAVSKDHTEVFQCMLELVSPEKRYELISTQNGVGATAVHLLAFHGHTEAMKSTLKDLTTAETLNLLQIQAKQGSTAIHWAASVGKRVTLEYIIDLLPPASQVRLLDIRNTYNRTPLEEAQYWKQQDTADLILQCGEAAESYQNESHDTDQDDAGNADLLRRLERVEVQSMKHLTEMTHEIARLKEYIVQLTNEVAEVKAAKVQLVRDREEQAVLLNEKVQKVDHFINETANQSRRITRLTNVNEEQNRRISELEALLASKDIEQQSSHEKVTLQDNKVNRVIHRAMSNTEDIEWIQKDQKATTEVVNRCERKVGILGKKVDYLQLRPVGGDGTVPLESSSYETEAMQEDTQIDAEEYM